MALSNLQKILEYSIKMKMDLSRDDLQHFNLIVAISEHFSRAHIIDLVDLFLKDLRFRAILLHR